MDFSLEGADTAQPVFGDWAIIHILADPESLNPLTANDATSQEINTHIFESLLFQNPQTLELEPNIADSLPTISPNRLTYRFRLRRNVYFSDGHPLTSTDVLFTLKAVKNPYVVEAAALRNYYDNVADVSTPDSFTVIIRMREPYFLAEYFLGGLSILPKHIFDPQGLTDRYTIAETNDTAAAARNPALQEFATWFRAPERSRSPQYIIGSGPYVLQEWKTTEYVRLRRNERYWNGDRNPWARRYPAQLVYRVISERTSALSALKNGDIDFMAYIPPKLFEEMLDTTATPYLRKVTYGQTSYSYIGWNLRRPFFSDKRVRQALSHLVNREALIRTIMLGYARPVNSPIYPGRPEYDTTLKPYEYNPERARQLLAEAGWRDSDGDGVLDKLVDGKRIPFELTFLINAGNEIRENIAVLLVDELQKVGIRARVQKLEWATFLQQVRSHQFDATILGWVADPIPSDPYQIWHSSQAFNRGSNYVGFINPRVDELLEKNRREFDPKKRLEYMREFQRIIHEEQP
ncbi:MAG: peptide-binding protein, partial [Bacteroidota bacterium]|nr:peptide-binding protein [Bacteroidota bacterium]